MLWGGNVFLKPREHALQDVGAMLGFLKTVGFSRVGDEFGFDTITFQAAIEFLALAERVDRIVVALQD